MNEFTAKTLLAREDYLLGKTDAKTYANRVLDFYTQEEGDFRSPLFEEIMLTANTQFRDEELRFKASIMPKYEKLFVIATEALLKELRVLDDEI